MRRPHWHSAMFASFSGALCLAMLAGCATRHSGSAADETARYLQNARGRYVIPGPASDPWGPYIREASNKYDIPESWIRALMRQESGGSLYRNGRLITSSAGAMGLMQVMPGTYAELRARYRYLGPDPFDPQDNIMAGVAYMREMYEMYGSPGFLAAYNAGPNRLDDYLANQRGLPDETRRYVAAIGPSLRYAAPRVHSPAERYAMNQLPLNIPPGPRFGYGSAMPTVQLASAAPVYKAPVFTAAATQPVYAPPVYTPPVFTPRVYAAAAPVQAAAPLAAAPPVQPRAVAWAEPPRPVYAPPPPQRAVVARVEEEDDSPVRRTHTATHHAQPTRVALAIPRVPPVQRSGGGLHLISSAMAAEVYSVRRGHKATATPVSYSKPHERPAGGPVWKLHATGPVQAPPCHKSHGKTVCGPDRL